MYNIKFKINIVIWTYHSHPAFVLRKWQKQE